MIRSAGAISPLYVMSDGVPVWLTFESYHSFRIAMLRGLHAGSGAIGVAETKVPRLRSSPRGRSMIMVVLRGFYAQYVSINTIQCSYIGLFILTQGY